MKTRFMVLCASLLAGMAPAWADWEVAAGSQIQFVSIKNNMIGEVSYFESISGTVTDAGAVSVQVALASVETNIGISNERMREFLFEVGVYPEAAITAQLDPEVLAAAVSGESEILSATLQIDLHGQMISKEASLKVSSTAQGLSATTTQPILLTASEFELEEGVAALQKIAGLNAISRIIPVTFALRFQPSTP